MLNRTTTTVRWFPIILIAVGGLLVAKAALMWSDASVGDDITPPVEAVFKTDAGSATDHAEKEGAADEGEAHTPADTASAPADVTPRSPIGSAAASNELLVNAAGEFSEQELKVLRQLAERRDALADRDRAIGRREALLVAAEARINEKIARLKDLQAVLESLVEKHDAEQERKLTSLVKIYENMKPKEAARIFEEMDMETLLPVVERMKERKLAAIMAQLNPSKAKEMTVELAQFRRLIDRSADFAMPQG